MASIFSNYYPALIQGLIVTLQMATIIWIVGILCGTALGLLSGQYPRLIGLPTRAISFFLLGIPILVLLFWLHYPAQALLAVVIDPFYTAVFALTLINIFSVSDLLRAAILNFPEQYLIAAKVTGLNTRQTALKIKLPIILRQVLPGILLLQVVMLQTTIFASLISVDEIFRTAQRINAQIYKPVEIYAVQDLYSICSLRIR
jgi:polar amino acid transport system permease protein